MNYNERKKKGRKCLRRGNVRRRVGGMEEGDEIITAHRSVFLISRCIMQRAGVERERTRDVLCDREWVFVRGSGGGWEHGIAQRKGRRKICLRFIGGPGVLIESCSLEVYFCAHAQE